MKSKSRYSLGSSVMVGCLSGLLITTAMPLSYADASPEPEVFSRDTVTFGRSYGEWSAAWWQWALSMPAAKHPLFDTAQCSEGQTGPVWFLGGNFCSDVNLPGCTPGVVERSCAVPADTALFFPVVNSEDSFLEERPVSNVHHPEFCAPQPTINCLRAFVESSIDPTTNLLAEIDGHAIPKLKERFRIQSTAFDFTLPEGHVLGSLGEGDTTPAGLVVPYAPGAYAPAVDDGVYVMVKPLPGGTHDLHIKGTFPQFDFNIDVTYHLTVTEQ
jgi:hypothetical protein